MHGVLRDRKIQGASLYLSPCVVRSRLSCLLTPVADPQSRGPRGLGPSFSSGRPRQQTPNMRRAREGRHQRPPPPPRT